MNKRFTKVLSVIMSILMLTCLIPAAFAAAPKGAGTEAAPYEIATADDLAYINNLNTAGKYFKLTADIDLTGVETTPIGSAAVPFKGIFDGDGHTILCDDDTYIENDEGENLGVFGYAVDAEIKNFTVDALIIEGKNNGGAAVGYAENTAIGNITVKGCSIDLTGSYAGGIVGKIVSGTVTVCTNTSTTVKAKVNYSGGIAGFSGAKIENCINGGTVGGSDNMTKYYYAGGIAASTTADITGCINKSKVYGNNNVGGIVGVIDGGKVTFCGNSANVEAYEDCGGIFCALNSGSVEYCYSAGTVTTKDAAYHTAGAIGSTAAGTVKNCVGVGSGDTFGSGNKNVIKRSASDLTDQSAFDGWDFENVWQLYETAYSHGYAYPVLKEMNFHTFAEKSKTAATCKTPEVITYECAVCKMQYSDTVGSKLPHTWDAGEIKAGDEATCVEGGTMTFTCTKCGETTTEKTPVDASAHIDNDGDEICDLCEADLKVPEAKKNIFQKIADFFRRIKEWFENLFAKIFKKK